MQWISLEYFLKLHNLYMMTWYNILVCFFQAWHRSMMGCPTVSWPWCSRCWWTCWGWYPCCWGSLPHWRSKGGTLGICWCTREPCWCCCPWPAGSCGTVATLRVWPPKRSWGEPWGERWTALPAPWVAEYGCQGLAAAQHKKSPLNDSSRPDCLRQRSVTAVTQLMELTKTLSESLCFCIENVCLCLIYCMWTRLILI